MLKMSSAPAISWIKSPNNSKALLDKLAKGAKLRGRAYAAIAEFVPVDFCTTDEKDTRELETASDLSPGSIESTKWVKAPTQRHEHQRVAHLLVNFSSAQAGNAAIAQGLVIKGKRIEVHRLTPEPSRCMKCQRYDSRHVAATCSASTDTCGTCGGEHRSNGCTVTAHADHFCVNCQTKGHAAWSRGCPHFLQKLQAMRERTPESALKYFPDQNDPSTWEMVDWAPPATTTTTITTSRSTNPFNSSRTVPSHISSSRPLAQRISPSSQPLPTPQPSNSQQRGRPAEARRQNFTRQDSGSRERRKAQSQPKAASQSRAPSQSSKPFLPRSHSRPPHLGRSTSRQMSILDTFSKKTKDTLDDRVHQAEEEADEAHIRKSLTPSYD